MASSGRGEWGPPSSGSIHFLSCPSGFFFLLFPGLSSPLFTLALVLLSPRSSESEVSVRRKVSLVLEQMQPLGVSDLLGSGLAP